MNLGEINQRVAELEKSVAMLTALKEGFIAVGAGADIINALADGICYTEARLREYKTTDWVMTKGIFDK